MVAETREEVAKESKLFAAARGRRYYDHTWENKDAFEEMLVAKTRLLKEYPFFGVLGLNLTLVEENSIPTMAVDGRHMFYNAEFALKLNRNERIFALGHEIYHVLSEHAGPVDKVRKGGRDDELWGYATDFVVNDDLLLSDIGEFITTISILHEERFRGLSAEEVYDILEEEKDKYKGKCQTFDSHLEVEVVPDEEWEEGGEGESKQHGIGGGRGTKIRMKQSEYDALTKEWTETLESAAAAQKEAEDAGRAAGKIPAGIQRMIASLMEPRVDWRTVLRQYVKSVISRGYSFNRPNKGLFQYGITIPSFRTIKNELDIVVIVDTSGSIGQEDLTAFCSEFNGILDSFPRYRIRAWCFDGAVIEESITTLEKGKDGKLEGIEKFIGNIGGGGGTDFMVNWQYMKEERLVPKLALMFTDGMPFSDWGIPGYCPTMFLIKGNKGARAPFGMTVHYEAPESID